MKFQDLIILLPCHSLEDFPQHHEGEDAAGLLAGWTALWHPALLAAAGAAPSWSRVDTPPEELGNRLIIVPSVSSGELPTGFAQRAKSDGACLIRKQPDRRVILETALGQLDGGDQGVPGDLAADFLALGYGFLQIQLLTRQMRYSSNLDELHFNNQLLEGARAAVQGDESLAQQKLSACFDLLAEERDHYYPVDAFLLDLTLLAENHCGQPLRDELAGLVPRNVLVCGSVLRQLAESEPDTLAAIRASLEAGRLGVLGGEETEGRVPLLPLEAILAELRRGEVQYEELLQRTVEVFGRRRFGLAPVLPQILSKLGFVGVLHATLEDGRFPQGNQLKTRWEGPDGSAIDALAKPPLDASLPETFLGLASKLGESMDMDHVATICLAHWPGHASTWYEDLQRCSKFGAALGKFVTAGDFFRDTYMPGQLDRFDADQYRAPYLKQSVIRRQADPISTVVRGWRRRAAADTIQTVESLLSFVSGDPPGGSTAELVREVDRRAEQSDTGELDDRLSRALDQSCRALAEQLPRKPAPAEVGYLAINPGSFVRRVELDVSGLANPPAVGKPIYAADQAAGSTYAVIDVPPLGFAWVVAGDRASASTRSTPSLAEDRRTRDGVVVLRNEFFEALINCTTGGLQSLKDYHTRGNRLSQQLALRMPGVRAKPGEPRRDPDKSAGYTVMAADSTEVTLATDVVGEVVVRGRLLDRQGQKQGSFRQTFRVWRGSRVLRVDVELDPASEPTSDPWNSYYACRFAWADESAEISRGVHQTRQVVGRKRFEAPQFVEINTGETRTSILTGGLPYHRLVGSRMLDTLLIVRGERERSFQLGIGVDLTNPLLEAVGLMAPGTALQLTAPPPATADSGWLFHLDSKSILATNWEPIVDEGRVAGVRARLLETSGRPGRARLSCFRSVDSARQVDFRGHPLGDCRIEDGQVTLDFAAHEWIELEARFATPDQPAPESTP